MALLAHALAERDTPSPDPPPGPEPHQASSSPGREMSERFGTPSGEPSFRDVLAAEYAGGLGPWFCFLFSESAQQGSPRLYCTVQV